MSRYALEDLRREAIAAARTHSKRNGGGRACAVSFELAVSARLTRLEVSYVANRPSGDCGVYRTTVAL